MLKHVHLRRLKGFAPDEVAQAGTCLLGRELQRSRSLGLTARSAQATICHQVIPILCMTMAYSAREFKPALGWRPTAPVWPRHRERSRREAGTGLRESKDGTGKGE